MTPKWTIRKYAVSSLGDEVALPWLLFEPGVSPPKLFHEAYWAACSMGETPSEVFAYVEYQTRKTRTVEVELPKAVEHKRLENEHGEDLIVHTSPSHTNIVNDWGDMEMNLRHAELKPLGEYLLALHYEKENS